MNTETALRHEVEVDTKLAELHGRLAKVNSALDSNKLDLAYACGVRPHYVTKTRREVRETATELAAKLAGMLADGKVAPYDVQRHQRTLSRREELIGERHAIRAEMEPLNEEFEAKRWTRFFLVTNQNGHIHESMQCSTCNPRTLFAWLPELSGLTEKDAVDAHGPKLCSVCYPTAPVEWTLGEKKEDPNQCPGTGTYDYDRETAHRTGWSGNGNATCTHCGQRAATTSTGKLRKHKRAA